MRESVEGQLNFCSPRPRFVFLLLFSVRLVISSPEGVSVEDVQSVFLNVKRSEYITCQHSNNCRRGWRLAKGVGEGLERYHHHPLTSSSLCVLFFSLSDGNTVSDVEANRLDYSEFCQALVAVAMYKSVNEHRATAEPLCCWLCIC